MRKVILGITIVAAIIATGCIDYEQTITVNDDLSGYAEFNVAMNPYLGGNMNEDGSINEDPVNFLVDDFAEVPGCEIVEDSYSYDADAEMEYFSARLKLDELNTLNGYGLYEQDKTLSVTEENGVIVYREEIMVQHEGATSDSSLDGEISEDEKMLKEMMEGYSFTYRVIMPNTVTDTNGDIGDDGHTVTWTWPTSEFMELGKVEVYAKCAK